MKINHLGLFGIHELGNLCSPQRQSFLYSATVTVGVPRWRGIGHELGSRVGLTLIDLYWYIPVVRTKFQTSELPPTFSGKRVVPANQYHDVHMHGIEDACQGEMLQK
jgi:hypothetical protein